ncbi:MAG: hypothetical protein AAFN79_08395 [Pseudomonadota bacterium]
MKHLITLMAAAFLATASLHASAQAEEAERETILPNEEELQRLGELAGEMFRRFAEEAEPMAERLRGLMEDLDAYEAPEIMPNGDIIIRRKPDADPAEVPETEEEGIAL